MILDLRKIVLVVIVCCLLLVARASAQTTVIKAVDPSTGTSTDVGDTTNHALRVNIIAGAGSGGTAMTDNSAMTLGTTAFTPAGGTFQTTVTSLSSGVAAAFRITAQRGLHINLRDDAGNELATTARPLWTQLGDGTNGPAAVKAASTAAVAADPALVMRSVQLPTALAASGGLKVDGSAVAQPVQGSNFDGITGASPLSPVTVGGHYLVTQPVYSDDAVTSFASTQRGALIVAPGVEGFPISAVALPLPTGASTSALQTTGNTSLSSIDTKTPALGQALAAASTPVVLTAAQVTTLTPPAAITGFALEATQTNGNQKTQITDGSASTGAYVSDRAGFAVQPLNGAVGMYVYGEITRALPAGIATIGRVIADAGTNLNTSGLALETGGNLAAIKTDVDKIPPLGQALAAASTPVVLTAIQLAALTPPAAITNYALETGGNLAQLVVNTRQRGSTSTPVMIQATDMDTTLLAANTSRVSWQVCNQSGSILLLKFGSGASPFSYNVRVQSGACYSDTAYMGVVNGAWFVGADRYAIVSETF